MALTGEEIRARLTVFAAKWSVYDGGERQEAQTFLNELFACYGTERQEVASFEQRQGTTFLDLLWPRVCVIEMKAPSETGKLATHRTQALDYWRNAADPATNVPSPRWVVLCSFRRLEIWEPGAFPNEPRLVLDLIDLPDQYEHSSSSPGPSRSSPAGRPRSRARPSCTSSISTSSCRTVSRPTTTFSATSCSRPSGASSPRISPRSPAIVSPSSSTA